MQHSVITLADTEPLRSSTPEPRLKSVNVADFVSMELKPREMVLASIIPQQGLAMAYAPRGIGKTYFGLSIACAVAAGGQFLTWTAPKSRPILYLDGEMPAVVMKERLSHIVRGMSADITDPNNFKLITPDLQDMISADISNPRGQDLIAPHLEAVELVIIDNLASLCSSGGENEGDSWVPIQSWLLRLRKAGKSVLLIHHAGKGGGQRGTSRREDVLDTVIAMRRPSDYSPDQGARFEIHFEKSRGIHGDEVKPVEAQLEVRDGAAMWTHKSLDDVEYHRVLALHTDGLSLRDIAEETGLSKSRVHRLINKAKALGALGDGG